LHPTESGFPRYYKSLGQFAKPATSSWISPSHVSEIDEGRLSPSRGQ
jgi:hypothetical protein